MPDMSVRILSNNEAKALILAFAHGRGDKGFAEDETQKLIDWAEDVRMQSAILKLILTGKLFVADIETDGSPKVIASE